MADTKLAAAPIVHGSPYGAEQHRRQGEAPCAACREAHNEYSTAHRVRVGKTNAVHMPVELLGELLDNADRALRAHADKVLGIRVTEACVGRFDLQKIAGGRHG